MNDIYLFTSYLNTRYYESCTLDLFNNFMNLLFFFLFSFGGGVRGLSELSSIIYYIIIIIV